MKKNDYIAPTFTIIDIDDEDILQSISGGGDDEGEGVGDAKSNLTLLSDYDDNYWEDSWK